MVRIVLSGNGGGGGDNASSSDALAQSQPSPADVAVDIELLNTTRNSNTATASVGGSGGSSHGAARSTVTDVDEAEDAMLLPGTPIGSTGGASVRLGTTPRSAANSGGAQPATPPRSPVSPAMVPKPVSRSAQLTTPPAAASKPAAFGAIRINAGGHAVKVDQHRGPGPATPPPRCGCANAEVQTIAYVPPLPPNMPHDRPNTARGSYSLVRKRRSTVAMGAAARRKSRIRTNRVAPLGNGDGGGDSLELDAPKRLQTRYAAAGGSKAENSTGFIPIWRAADFCFQPPFLPLLLTPST